MVFTGSFSEIDNKLNWYLSLFKESVLLNNDFSIDVTITTNGRKVILIDGNTLEEVKFLFKNVNSEEYNAFVMDEEIYHIFYNYIVRTPDMNTRSDHISMACNKTDENKTDIIIPKSDKQNTQIKPRELYDIENKEVTQAREYDKIAKTDKNMNLNSEYRIEEHLEESMRLNKPCVFGIKYVDDNVFVLFYRNSVYDKGSDTTFRHYLCQQPGTLVAYIYFKELNSLRFQFEQFGKKLRHNGQNILSREQSDYLVHYFTKCWI